MPQKGSYHIQSFSADVRAEIRRLDAQVDLFWPVESEVLVRYGLGSGKTLLDCGCGTGRLIELLKKRLPGLQCTGLESDQILVEAGRSRMTECGFSDVVILQGTAEIPGLDNGSFDFIVLRMVLEHVPDPAAALRSLNRLLRPQGRLIVISNDFDFHLRTFPAVPELDALYAAYCSSRQKDGGDPRMGRRAPKLLVESGLALVGCETELAHSAVIGDAPFLKAEGAGIPLQLVRTGFLDEQALERMTRSWREMLSAPEHSIARMVWVAVGEKAEKAPSKPAAAAVEDGGSVQTGDHATGMIMTLLMDILKRKDIMPNETMMSLGMDSISAIIVQERIKNLTGVEIPIIRLLESESANSLARFVESHGDPDGDVKTGGSGIPPEATRWEEGEL